MTEYLLDTHTLIWHSVGDQRLSEEVGDTISDVQNLIFVSVASYWEMAIKASLNKLELPGHVDEFRLSMEEAGIQTIDINGAHLHQIQIMPFPESGHRDPFDRMIIATAMVEGMAILGKDSHFSSYAVELIW